jgi:hypothetical protein
VTMTVCFSRCLYCGRLTRHEVCHRHSTRNSRLGDIDPSISAEEWQKRMERSSDRAWKRWYGREPETCPPGCTVDD